MEVKHGLGYQNYEDLMCNHIFYIDKTLSKSGGIMQTRLRWSHARGGLGKRSI